MRLKGRSFLAETKLELRGSWQRKRGTFVVNRQTKEQTKGEVCTACGKAWSNSGKPLFQVWDTTSLVLAGYKPILCESCRRKAKL